MAGWTPERRAAASVATSMRWATVGKHDHAIRRKAKLHAGTAEHRAMVDARIISEAIDLLRREIAKVDAAILAVENARELAAK